jgi:uncharacterized repeat protein (TIGR01451 family)
MAPFRSLAPAARAVAMAVILTLAFFGAAVRAQTISNTASLTHAVNGGDRTVLSNTVSFTLRGKLPTRLDFRQLPQGFTLQGMACGAGPVFTPAPVSVDELAAARPLDVLDVENPMILVLEAPGENRDPLSRETVRITERVGGHQGSVVLLETGPNSGVFAGGMPATGQYGGLAACDIGVHRGDGNIVLDFPGSDYSFSSTASLLIDPEGYVFDSRTGDLINGATITLIDEATGAPATRVFGDDGVSAYPSTVVSGGTVTDAGGEVYRFTRGNFRFPLSPAGRYRLRIVPPDGYSAPSVVSAAALATLPSPVGGYIITDASYGGVLTLQGAAPVRVDIPLDHATPGALVLDKTASVREAEPGDFVQYRLELRNTGVGAATNIGVTDNLPRGLRYRVGSTRGAPEPVVAADARTLRFTLPTLASGATTQITYLVEIAPGAPTGEAVNSASAVAPGSTSSNLASASVRIRAPLFTDAFTVIGRVTEGGCHDPERGRKGIAGIRLLMEDGTYVVTDADGLYHFEGVSPGTHVVQMDLGSVPATHAPVVCDADTRAAQSSISRFVEGTGGSLQRVDFQLRPTGKAAEAADALPITPAGDAQAAGNRDDWLALATPGTGWLFPDENHNPRAPAVRVVIRHDVTQRVALTINGKPVDPLSFDGSDSDKARGVAVSRWTGLGLIEGDNKLEARVLDASGAVATTLTRIVHYANTPAKATYIAEKSRLVADGLTRPLIAVRVTDRDGRPVRAGAIVPFRVDQPYQAAQAVAAEQGRQLAGLERTQATTRVVGDEGLAFIALQPTRQAGTVRIAVTLADRERDLVSDVKARLSAPAQDWVVVGFGKGTLGYDILSGAERRSRGESGRVVTDGQLSLYAKGRIKGSWLMTIAYDSDKDEERMRERGVLGTIDPDRYYTVYGDGTLQGYDAQSRRKLYLRLERRDFYALYGDFETGLVDTRLSRYSRTMNGVKAEYSGNRVQFTAFAANDDSRYGRDEIQGNGLSGPYRLSARDLVPNSDKLRLETRDRFRSERVLDSRMLTRHIDYDIDPVAGTLRFREPILSRDSDLNPVFIVADYETYGGSKKLAAGGRAAVTVGRAEIGATLLRDETDGNGTVAGVDLRFKATANTEIRAEAATGGRDGIGKGQAWLAEVEHHGSKADVLAYVRQQDREFGLGQQNLGEAGTRKIGVDGRIKIGGRWSLAGSAWYQNDLDEAARRLAGELKVEYRRNTGTLFAGMQIASDRGIDGAARDSRLLTFGGTQNLFKNKLEVTAESQIPLGGKDDSVDFPARQRIGAGWRFNDWLKLIGGFEVAKGDKFTAQTGRLGFDVAPWGGARILTTLNQGAIGENGSRTYAQYGLSQSLPLGKRWTIDATVDSSGTLSGRIPRGDVVNPFHPVASGGSLGSDGVDGDFVATTLGATYRGELWSWNGRIEFRTGTREQRWGLTSNLLRTLGGGSTIASSVRAYRVREASGAVVSSIDADVALALRPIDSRWSLLERFQLRQEGAGVGTSSRNALAVPTFAQGSNTTFRAINNVAVNYRTGSEGAGHGFEASLYYGAKYVRGRYADERVDGFLDVVGLEVRKDVTAHLDIGGNASVQHSWSNGAAQLSLGASVGVSPGKNLWFTAGYNVTGYRDRDFEESRWTRQGPYITARLKFDQLSLRDMAKPILGRGR